MMLNIHVDYKYIVIAITLIAVVGKVHEMVNSFDMLINPLGMIIKVVGIIALTIWFVTDDAPSQTEDR